MERLTHNGECPVCGTGIETIVTADYSEAIRAAVSAHHAQVVAAVEKAIEDALAEHRLRHQRDDDDSGYPLADALTPEGDDNIQRGEEEVDAIADAVCGAVTDALAALAPTGGSNAE